MGGRRAKGGRRARGVTESERREKGHHFQLDKCAYSVL